MAKVFVIRSRWQLESETLGSIITRLYHWIIGKKRWVRVSRSPATIERRPLSHNTHPGRVQKHNTRRSPHGTNPVKPSTTVTASRKPPHFHSASSRLLAQVGSTRFAKQLAASIKARQLIVQQECAIRDLVVEANEVCSRHRVITKSSKALQQDESVEPQARIHDMAIRSAIEEEKAGTISRLNKRRFEIYKARQRCRKIYDRTLMADTQKLVEESGVLDKLVDRDQLCGTLFGSEADDFNGSEELLPYLSSEGQGLSKHLAVSMSARIIINDLIRDTEKFRSRYLDMKKDLEACERDIGDFRNQGLANHDPRVLEKEHQVADIRLKIDENDEKWEAANDSIDLAQSRLRLLDRRFFLRARELVQGSGLLDGKVDEERLRRQLFEGEHIGSQDGDEAQEQPRNEDETDTQADQELKDAERDAAREEREEAISAALEVAELLASRIEGYHTALNQHLNGQDPGIPDWSPSWSKEEFDLRRLRHLQQLTGEQIAAERRCMRAIIRARDAGVDPLESMRFAFPDRTDDGVQGSGDGTRAIATAPRHRVREWLENIPVTPIRLRNDEPGSPPSRLPDLRTPMNWESFSTRATPGWRDRFIQEAGPRGPRGETPEPVPEVGESEDLFKKFRYQAQDDE